MIYLASPYSHPDPAVMQARFEAAARATGELMKAGHVVYSPIAHNHPIAQLCDMPTGWEFWKRLDLAVLERCDKLIVLMLDDWDASVGVNDETAFALSRGMAVEYLPPGEAAEVL